MKKNLLIVEDDETIIFILKRIFEKEGIFELKFADDYYSAMNLVNNHEIGIIVMDVNVNGEYDGLSIAEEIRKRFKIPIVFHSNNDFRLLKNRINQIENSYYFEKDGIYIDLHKKLTKLSAELQINN